MASSSGLQAIARRLALDLLIVAASGAALTVALLFATGRFSSEIPSIDVALLFAGAVVVVGYLFARALSSAVERYLRAEGTYQHAGGVRLVLNLIVALGVVLALFRVFGVSIETIFFGSAFAGIVLGLAAQAFLSNVFAGLSIVLSSPFRAGDHVVLISANYGAIGPSYPHELMYSTYAGTVVDIGVFYTQLRLDTGELARVPNSVVLSALVVDQGASSAHGQRVRMSFASSTPPRLLDELLPELTAEFAGPGSELPPPRVEVADIGPASWDGVVVVWTRERNEALVRDRVLRVVLGRVATLGPRPAPR